MKWVRVWWDNKKYSSARDSSSVKHLGRGLGQVMSLYSSVLMLKLGAYSCLSLPGGLGTPTPTLKGCVSSSSPTFSSNTEKKCLPVFPKPEGAYFRTFKGKYTVILISLPLNSTTLLSRE